MSTRPTRRRSNALQPLRWLLLLGGALSACAPEPDVELSVYLRPQGASQLTATGDGRLVLHVDEPLEVPVVAGYTRVGGIPAQHLGERVSVTLELEGYRLAEPDATVLVQRGGIANLGVVAD